MTTGLSKTTRIFALAVVVVCAGLMLRGRPVHATAMSRCIDVCFSGFTCATAEHNGQTEQFCEAGRDRCVKQCNDTINGKNEDAAPARGAYGALAYDRESGAWGMADASTDKDGAEKSALDYCTQQGGGCQVVESFNNTCAAVASGTGNRLGWAVNENEQDADRIAIEKCGDSGSSGDAQDKSRCFLQLSHCYAP